MINPLHLLSVRRKRNNIKKYILQLGPLLARTYGKAEHYSPERVRKTIQEAKMPTEEAVYALVLYCTPAQFAADQKRYGGTSQYWPLRVEIMEYNFRYGRDTTPGGVGSDSSFADYDALHFGINMGDHGF